MEPGLGQFSYWIGAGLSWTSLLGCLALTIRGWAWLRPPARRLWVAALPLYAVVLVATPVALWLGAEHVLRTFGASRMVPMIYNASGWGVGLLMAGSGAVLFLVCLASTPAAGRSDRA